MPRSPFGEPEGATPPPMTTVAPERQPLVPGHGADSAARPPLYSGMERFDAIGIAAGVRISERFSITGDDPLSATAALA